MFEGRTGFLTGNLVLDLSILAWFLAQLIKTVANLVVNRNLDLKRMVGSGDMPSSHSSFICAATASIGQIYGWQAPLFSLAAVVALVVMYDACNVRRAAGEQAKVLNYVMAHWKEMPEELKPKKKLNEHLGHTLPQVLMGALLGTAIGITGPMKLSNCSKSDSSIFSRIPLKFSSVIGFVIIYSPSTYSNMFLYIYNCLSVTFSK